MHELHLDAGRCLHVAAILVEQVVLHLHVRSAPTSYRHTEREQQTCVRQGSVHEHAMHRLPFSAADQHRKCNRQHNRPPGDRAVVPTKPCGERGQDHHLPVRAGGIRKRFPMLCGLRHTRNECTQDVERGGGLRAARASRAQVRDLPVRSSREHLSKLLMMFAAAPQPVRLALP